MTRRRRSHRKLLVPMWTAGAALCFASCSGMAPEAKSHSTPARQVASASLEAEPEAEARPVDAIAMDEDATVDMPAAAATPAPPAPRKDLAASTARTEVKEAKKAERRTRASAVGAASGAPAQLATKGDLGGAMSSMAGRVARAKPAGPSVTRRPPAPPAEPQWMAQGASAPGGDFAGRDARINDFTHADQDRLSTFAIDVDTAAYSIARRTLTSDRMPTASLVRVEEFVNYFKYDYAPPKGARELFSIQADGAASPVDGTKHMLRVGVQAKDVSAVDRMPANLVFLIDTSCSMTSKDKLDLTKRALSLAVDKLDRRDRVAITTYAGGVRLILPPTSGDQKHKIKAALRRLRSGGGTAMSSGLELAYKQASKMLSSDSVTRIIVCSDGDANIGATSAAQILKRIEGYKSEGVFLSTIGFGHGNYKDSMMEQLANKGNGNYFYVDSMRQAERIFSRDLFKMVQDVAQDVKIQVEFDPASVASYRLVGYENRDIADKDFRNDKVDAGEIGAGHQVTALYELILTEQPAKRLATIRVRAKQPRGTVAKEVGFEVGTHLVTRDFEEAPEDLRFATAVMGGAELLRGSPHAEGWSFKQVIALVSETRPYDEPDRAEFLSLMKKASWLSGESRPVGMR